MGRLYHAPRDRVNERTGSGYAPGIPSRGCSPGPKDIRFPDALFFSGAQSRPKFPFTTFCLGALLDSFPLTDSASGRERRPYWLIGVPEKKSYRPLPMASHPRLGILEQGALCSFEGRYSV